MSDAIEQLDSRQTKVLCALVSGSTIEKAAKTGGVDRSTVFLWLKEEAFSTAYREARRNVVTQATTTLQAACGEAVAALKEVANDKEAPPASRVSAARVILEMSVKAVEIDDLAARIEALESTLEKQPEGKRW